MVAGLRFTKMQGIGNDYVYVNGFEERVDNPGELAKRISDRHFGVGSDGLVLILPSGGRVMIVVCRSADPEQARCRALEEVRKIGCENLFYRSDIGMKALSFLVKK